MSYLESIYTSISVQIVLKNVFTVTKSFSYLNTFHKGYLSLLNMFLKYICKISFIIVTISVAGLQYWLSLPSSSATETSSMQTTAVANFRVTVLCTGRFSILLWFVRPWVHFYRNQAKWTFEADCLCRWLPSGWKRMLLWLCAANAPHCWE